VRHLIHSAVRAGAPHSRKGSQRFLEPPVLFMGDEPCHTGKLISASTCRSALAVIGRKRPLGTLVDSSTVSRIRTSLSGKTPAGLQGHDLRRSGLASRRWLAFQCTAGHCCPACKAETCAKKLPPCYQGLSKGSSRVRGNRALELPPQLCSGWISVFVHTCVEVATGGRERGRGDGARTRELSTRRAWRWRRMGAHSPLLRLFLKNKRQLN
jgi:hypothetical protein